MSKQIQSVSPRSLLLQLLAGTLMMSSVACATNHDSAERQPESFKEGELSFTSELSVRNNVETVNKPRILVKFEHAIPGDPQSALCPTGTAFRIKVGSGPEATTVTLPTDVPTNALPIDQLQEVVWVAADDQYNEIPNLSDFDFGVFFHPFQGTDNVNYRSRSVRVGGASYTVIGPLNMRAKRLLPENVDYKYSVATIEEVEIGGELRWALVEDCKPLDPRIRVY